MNQLEGVSPADLATRVVIYRALGLDKELATQCMAELLLRESRGETFDYQQFIEQELAKFPKTEKKVSANLFQKAMNVISNFTK